METALWNGNLYTISEIADDYALENRIRAAKKELICPDPNCVSPILKYCHGDQRNYFAHLRNCGCNYTRYEKTLSPLIRKVKPIVYDVLKVKGFNVEIDAKITETEYTHLLIRVSDEKRIAIEFATPQISLKKLEKIMGKYQHAHIEPRWIVVSNFQTPLLENATCLIKRYLLNESINRDVIILDEGGSKLVQYKEDRTRNRLNPKTDIYSEYSDVFSLTVENTAVTIDGFNERYEQWLDKRNTTLPTIENHYSKQENDKVFSVINNTEVEEQKIGNVAKKISNVYPNAEKICPSCGLPMVKKKNAIGLLFWRCISDNRDHSIRVDNE